MAFSFEVAFTQKRIDGFITGDLLQQLFFTGLDFLEPLFDVLEAFILPIDIILHFIKHFDWHNSQLFGFLSPEEIQFFNEHFLLLIVLLKLDVFLFKFFKNGLDFDKKFLASFDLRIELTIDQVTVVDDMCQVVHSQFVYYVVGILSGDYQLIMTHFS